ncbi:MAG: type II secretion system F family protein [Clostridia bacterium]|nr:type II secretion system F family protein [Clostridia bacterium]
MRKFKYTAVNLNKETFKGIFIAEDEKDLATQLSSQGLFLVSCVPYSDKSPNVFFSVSGKVKRSELTVFARQFAIMINAGISIVGCMEILQTQKYSALFRSVLERIYEDVKGGMMLSDAIKKHKKVFPSFFSSMIKVGEASGKLDQVLISLADYYESDSKIKKKVKTALTYPTFLFVMMIAVVVIMLAFVVPSFRDSLSKLDIEPTGLTATVYAISDFIIQDGLTVLAIVLVVGLVGFLVSLTPKGKYWFDVFMVKCPIIGKITTELITARFARGFGLLLSSGMDIVEAMENICIVLGNSYVENRFKKAIEEVKQGMTLTTAFDKYKLFPPLMLQMISVGEKSASLDDVLMRSCNFFDEQVETSLTSLTAKIQPTILIIMGAIVAVLFMAVYSPMLEIMNNLGV